MTAPRRATAVHAWYSPGCDTVYSVSLVDDDGDEITCVGGANFLGEVWDDACAEADDRGIPALLMPDESGRVTRHYEPPGKDAD